MQDTKPTSTRTGQRTKALLVRFRPDELADLHAVARGQKMRTATFVRTSIGRSINIVPELNQQAWAELSRVSSNLNQLAKRLNQTGIVNQRIALAELQALRAALVGARQGLDHDAD